MVLFNIGPVTPFTEYGLFDSVRKPRPIPSRKGFALFDRVYTSSSAPQCERIVPRRIALFRARKLTRIPTVPNKLFGTVGPYSFRIGIRFLLTDFLYQDQDFRRVLPKKEYFDHIGKR